MQIGSITIPVGGVSGTYLLEQLNKTTENLTKITEKLKQTINANVILQKEKG